MSASGMLTNQWASRHSVIVLLLAVSTTWYASVPININILIFSEVLLLFGGDIWKE
jgi:hypothetical protein